LADKSEISWWYEGGRESRYGDSWLRRDPLKAFGRAVWQAVIVIYCQLLQVLRRPVETTPRSLT
jgi:hypothetical protein